MSTDSFLNDDGVHPVDKALSVDAKHKKSSPSSSTTSNETTMFKTHNGLPPSFKQQPLEAPLTDFSQKDDSISGFQRIKSRYPNVYSQYLSSMFENRVQSENNLPRHHPYRPYSKHLSQTEFGDNSRPVSARALVWWQTNLAKLIGLLGIGIVFLSLVVVAVLIRVEAKGFDHHQLHSYQKPSGSQVLASSVHYEHRHSEQQQQQHHKRSPTPTTVPIIEYDDNPISTLSSASFSSTATPIFVKQSPEQKRLEFNEALKKSLKKLLTNNDDIDYDSDTKENEDAQNSNKPNDKIDNVKTIKVPIEIVIDGGSRSFKTETIPIIEIIPEKKINHHHSSRNNMLDQQTNIDRNHIHQHDDNDDQMKKHTYIIEMNIKVHQNGDATGAS